MATWPLNKTSKYHSFILKRMPISGDKLFHQVGLFLDARRAAEIGAHHQQGRGQVGVRVHGQARQEAEG